MNLAKRSRKIGILILFLSFIVTGSIASLLYIAYQDRAISLFIAGFMGAVLAFVFYITVKTCMSSFKLSGGAGVIFTVIAALLVIHFLKWNMFFALQWWRAWHWEYGYSINSMFTDFGGYLSYLRYITLWSLSDLSVFIDDFRVFNYYGTWATVDLYGRGENVRGVLLAFIWIGEFILISTPPIYAAATGKVKGIFIESMDVWATPFCMPFRFYAFSDEEMDKISYGDIDIIVNRPLAGSYEPNCVVIADLYVEGVLTDYIAIFKANDGDNSMGKHIHTFRLGRDKIRELDEKLRLTRRGDYLSPKNLRSPKKEITHELS